MKKALLLIVAIIIGLALTSCGTLLTKGGSDYRSGLQSYEKQEYVTSLRYLSNALAVNSEFEEALLLYPKVFNEGTAYYTTKVTDYSDKEDRQSADTVFYAYVNLTELHSIAKADGRNDLPIQDYSEAIAVARIASANAWYLYGQSLYEKGDRESIKQAVAAFETARGRDTDIQGLDALIAKAIEEATVTLAVVAYGSGVENFSHMVVDEVTDILAGNRFVEVVQKYDYRGGEGSMVGPTDLGIMEAMAKGWEYVLEVYAHQGFDEINQETPVGLPSDNPLFAGIKKTIGYKHDTTISYRLFNVEKGVATIAEDTLREVDGPYEYTVSYVGAEGLRELNFDGSGKQNLRYVTSSASDAVTDAALYTLRWDYENIPIPLEITDPTEQTQWIAYFNNRYSDFSTFVQNESKRELLYAVEVVHHTPSDTYFMVGPSLQAAIRQSKINSAIMNALSYTARKLIEVEEEQGGVGYLQAGSWAGNAIKSLF